MLIPKVFEYDFVVDSEETTQIEDYKIISSVLSELCKSGALMIGKGYSISISQMIADVLSHRGIKSELFECKLAITYTDKNKISFIGYDNIANPGEMDTHIVVVTKTNFPLLIDGSISHKLPEEHLAAVALFRNGDHCAVIDRPDLKLIMSYTAKEKQQVPVAHQRSIIDRLETDKKIFSNLLVLKLLIALALIMSTGNALRGAYDFYQTYYVSGNNWGPDHNRKVLQRLEELEKKLNGKKE